MRQYQLALAPLSLLSIALLAGCGGGGGGNQVTKIQFSSVVTFGDSLSDVGSYNVGAITALGGGHYTVNSQTNGAPTPSNWTELITATLGQTPLCAAETGLQGSGPGFSVPITLHPTCTSYAMGGARVTNAVGPGNALLGGSNAILGQLTIPVVTQIGNHLALHSGAFSGNEVVFVLAGGNDAILQFTAVANQVSTPTAAVTAMGQAGGELAGYVNNLLVGKGAHYVVVVNLPDLSTTPMGTSAEAAAPGSQALINTMVTTFNTQLQSGLVAGPNILYVDAHAISADQVKNPAIYGLTNVTTPACNLSPSVNALGSSLVCNASNVVAGDVSHYQFADTVHPTPYGNLLLARYVSSQMAIKGWL
jgi:phospholipase/lecithinase/hemolysin